MGTSGQSILMALVVLSMIWSLAVSEKSLQSQGYLLFCPCMGRFGNQADQFLGSLAFSEGLGRTLVLPPWISYSSRSNNIKLIPWDSVFNLTILAQHQPVVTMETFMTSLSKEVWPEGERVSLCYSPRPGRLEQDCNAKHGSPFGPFWDSFQVSFDHSVMFSPLNFNTGPDNLRRWSEKFPVPSHPVLALTGAPATFPVQRDHLHLQRYLTWTDQWLDRAKHWVKDNMGQEVEYLGIHLRNGVDWSKACDHTETAGLGNLFSSAQCLGYSGDTRGLTRELCLPTEETIILQLGQTLRRTDIKHVYVASDNNHMIEIFSKTFSGVQFYKQHNSVEDGFLLDLVILSQGNHFVGNCVSSFTAFVKRTRDVLELESSFWTFSLESGDKTEL